MRDLERFIEFIQTNKEAKDLDLPQLPNDSANRGCDKISRSKFWFFLGIISRGISAIIKIGSILPYVFLRNFGCQKDKIASKYPENTESVQDNSNVISSPPGSTKEIIKPAEIQVRINIFSRIQFNASFRDSQNLFLRILFTPSIWSNWLIKGIIWLESGNIKKKTKKWWQWSG